MRRGGALELSSSHSPQRRQCPRRLLFLLLLRNVLTFFPAAAEAGTSTIAFEEVATVLEVAEEAVAVVAGEVKKASPR